MRYFGAIDSPEARDSVFRFRKTFLPPFGWVGDLDVDICRAIAPVESLEFVFATGTLVAAILRNDELVRCRGEKALGVSDFGVSKGFIGISSPWSFEPNGFSPPSFGRRDSVEPLFLSDLLVGRLSGCSNRASSICRNAI